MSTYQNSNNNTSSIWQVILSMDAKFNLYRINSNSQLRTQYMRRRTQLMRENAAKYAGRSDVLAERRSYLNIRGQILERKYGQHDQVSISSHGHSQRGGQSTYPAHMHRTHRLFDSVSLSSESNAHGSSSYKRYGGASNIMTALNPQQSSSFMYSSKESLNNSGNNSNSKQNSRSNTLNSIDHTYSTAGVHHVFEAHKGAVTRIRFANNDKSLLASSAIDGLLCIYQVIPSPATIIYKLEGHATGIVDFQWSTTNDLIVTASLDGTSRVWQVAKGKCMRVLKDTSAAQVLCCCFQPLNENMIFTGNSKGYIQVYNLSTGILGNKNCLQKISARVQCLCFDSSGFNLWVGDDKGGISTFHFDVFTLKLSKTRKMVNNPGYSITSISYRNLTMKESCLLVNAMPNYLLLYKISNEESTVTLSKRIAIKQAEKSIRSVFCPKVGNVAGNKSHSATTNCFVCTGSEDAGLYIYDMNNVENPLVNKLQGHSSPVLDVSFNYDQSLLASADNQGCVIVWKTNNQL